LLPEHNSYITSQNIITGRRCSSSRRRGTRHKYNCVEFLRGKGRL